MTWALCFNCGAIKFGALCPCPECEVASTGHPNLHILFSDHRMSKDTLAAFGEVVRSIRRVCDDEELRFWSFIYFVSTNHPDLMGASLPADDQQRCAEILARARPLPVTVEESERARMKREFKEREGSA